MKLSEALNDIEEALSASENHKLEYICKKYFPEEDFGEDYNSGIIDDIFVLIIELASCDTIFTSSLYFYLLDEKITIDEDEFYSEEEIDHG